MLAQRIARQHREQHDDSFTALVALLATQDAGAAGSLDGSFHPDVARAPRDRRR